MSRFYDAKVWPSRGVVYGEWRGASAGGCVNYESVRDNVQYALTLLDAGPADISVSLLQEDVRGVEGKVVGDFPVIILECYDNQGKPITRSAKCNKQREDRYMRASSSHSILSSLFPHLLAFSFQL